eukprot:scaffold39838_cov70-Phaeocystis_antarctica.AAC.3
MCDSPRRHTLTRPCVHQHAFGNSEQARSACSRLYCCRIPATAAAQHIQTSCGAALASKYPTGLWSRRRGRRFQHSPGRARLLPAGHRR